jgi:hypothetical protein
VGARADSACSQYTPDIARQPSAVGGSAHPGGSAVFATTTVAFGVSWDSASCSPNVPGVVAGRHQGEPLRHRWRGRGHVAREHRVQLDVVEHHAHGLPRGDEPRRGVAHGVEEALGEHDARRRRAVSDPEHAEAVAGSLAGSEGEAVVRRGGPRAERSTRGGAHTGEEHDGRGSVGEQRVHGREVGRAERVLGQHDERGVLEDVVRVGVEQAGEERDRRGAGGVRFVRVVGRRLHHDQLTLAEGHGQAHAGVAVFVDHGDRGEVRQQGAEDGIVQDRGDRHGLACVLHPVQGADVDADEPVLGHDRAAGQSGPVVGRGLQGLVLRGRVGLSRGLQRETHADTRILTRERGVEHVEDGVVAVLQRAGEPDGEARTHRRDLPVDGDGVEPLVGREPDERHVVGRALEDAVDLQDRTVQVDDRFVGLHRVACGEHVPAVDQQSGTAAGTAHCHRTCSPRFQASTRGFVRFVLHRDVLPDLRRYSSGRRHFSSCPTWNLESLMRHLILLAGLSLACDPAATAPGDVAAAAQQPAPRCVADDFEPNDFPGEEVPILDGTTWFSEDLTACGWDEDVFTFVAPARHTVNAWVSYVHADGDVDLGLDVGNGYHWRDVDAGLEHLALSTDAHGDRNGRVLAGSLDGDNDYVLTVDVQPWRSASLSALFLTPGVNGLDFQVDGNGAGTTIVYAEPLGWFSGGAAVPACPGLTLQLSSPVEVGRQWRWTHGDHDIAVTTPSLAAGSTWVFQSVNLASCTVSEVAQATVNPGWGWP